jgi:hypothetical protein
MNGPSARFRTWLPLAGGILIAAAALAWWMAGVFSDQGPPPAAGPGPLVPLRPAPAGERAAAELRGEVREILALGRQASPGRRLELLRTCGDDLNGAERDALLAALAQPRDPAAGAGWHAEYFHGIALVLRRLPPIRGRFARVLACVAADHSREEVVRDYALQHLREVWERSGDTPRLRASITETFRQLADDELLGPTALLSLHLLGFDPGGSQAAVPTAELEPLVLRALDAPPGPGAVPMRLGSLRIAAERGMPGALPGIRRIAADSAGEHALARMAAIAALGRLGGSADRAMIEGLGTSPDPRIAAAARHALAALQ